MGFFPRESLIPWKFHGTASGPKPKKNTFLQLYYTIPHTLLPGDGIETGCPLSQVDLNSWKLEESYDFISKHTTHTYLRVTVFFCLYSFQRWVQGRSDDRVRGVISNGLCGADRHYTGVCFEQPAHQLLSLFLVLLGSGFVAVLAAFVFTILLDAEMRVDGLTYFDVA